MTKKILALLLSVCFVFSLSSCSKDGEKADGKLSIVTSLFPQYDFARRVAGDFADVKLLLSPGVEAHSYDPTYRDIEKISAADIFIYTGDEMEPWAEKVLNTVGERERLTVVDLSDGISLMKEEDHDEHEHDHDHDHEYDPHIWLDLQNAVRMLDSVTNAVCEKDPEHSDVYRGNGEKLKTELLDLDKQFESEIENAGDKTIVFGGRFAYRYFTERYGLNYRTVYDSCSTDVEPSAKTVTEITDFIKTNGVKYIYHEELADPKVAASIAAASGAELLEFSTAQTVSKDEFERGIGFADVMRRNLANLKKGLE